MASLIKRSNGIYYMTYYMSGRQRWVSLKTKKKRLADIRFGAEVKKLEERRLGLADGLELEMPIKELLKRWLVHAKLHCRVRTVTRYEQISRNFLAFCGETGLTAVGQLTPRVFEAYKGQRVSVVARATVNNELRTLRGALNFAQSQGYIRTNPLANVRKFGRLPTRERFFSEEEVQQILSNCTQRYYPIFLTLALTGMRRGELENLEWPDVDLRSGVIAIREKPGWSPKTAEREIPIGPALVAVLREFRSKTGPFGLVFHTASGKPHTNVYRYFKRLCRRLGIPDANLHTWRHTAASHLVRTGLSLRIVQQFLGHRHIATTMQYSHLAPDDLVVASRVIEQVLLSGPREPAIGRVRIANGFANGLSPNDREEPELTKKSEKGPGD